MFTPEQVEHIAAGPVLAFREDAEGLTLINAIGQKVCFTQAECWALLPPKVTEKPAAAAKALTNAKGSSRAAPTK
jgi:hypothetical protein